MVTVSLTIGFRVAFQQATEVRSLWWIWDMVVVMGLFLVMWPIARRFHKWNSVVLTQMVRHGRVVHLVGWSLILALLGGLWRGSAVQSNLAEFVGKPSLIQAAVISIHPINHGTSVMLTMRSIQDGGAGITPVTRTLSDAKATWIVWGTVPNGLTVGTTLTAYGTLELPPLLDSQGRPLREQLAKYGIRYSWKGRVSAITNTGSSWPTHVRQWLDSKLRSADPARRAIQPLAESILFGGASSNRALNQAFLAAGLLHVLAASGANVILLLRAADLVIYPFWRMAKLPPHLWSAWLIAPIWMFCALCGTAPSIVRASIMATYAQLGAALGRSPSIGDGLLMAVGMMTWFDAKDVGSISSLLSMSATCALALGSRHGQRVIQSSGIFRWTVHHVLNSVWVTLRIELALIPMTIGYFGQITPYSLLSNIIAEPLLACLLPAIALYLVLATLSSFVMVIRFLCEVCGWVLSIALHGLEGFVTTVSHWHGSLILVPSWPPGLVIFYYSLFFIAFGQFGRLRLLALCYTYAYKFVKSGQRS